VESVESERWREREIFFDYYFCGDSKIIKREKKSYGSLKQMLTRERELWRDIALIGL